MERQEELKEYLRSHLEQGFNTTELIDHLRSAGWHDDHIQPALQWALAAHTAPAPALSDLPPAQMHNTQPIMQSSSKKKTMFGKGKMLMAAGLAALLLVMISAGLFFKLQSKETPKQTFEKTIAASMRVGSFHQKFTDKSSEDGEVILDVQTDFRDPKTPKLSGTLTMTMDLDKQASVNGILTIKQQIIAIGDKVYVKTTDFKSEKLSDEIKNQLLLLSENKNASVDDVIMANFGIPKLNTWVSFDASDYGALLASQGTFTSVIATLGTSINTVLGQYIIGDLGANATQTATDAIASGIYTIDYKNVTKQNANNTEYLVYKVGLNNDKIKTFNTSLATKLGLSERDKSIINEGDKLQDKTAVFWIDTERHLPYKVVFNQDENQTVEYSDFNANYSIKAPL